MRCVRAAPLFLIGLRPIALLLKIVATTVEASVIGQDVPSQSRLFLSSFRRINRISPLYVTMNSPSALGIGAVHEDTPNIELTAPEMTFMLRFVQ